MVREQVKKQNFQTRSGLLWFPELSFLLEVKGGGTAYNPKALKLAHRKWGVSNMAAKADDLSSILQDSYGGKRKPVTTASYLILLSPYLCTHTRRQNKHKKRASHLALASNGTRSCSRTPSFYPLLVTSQNSGRGQRSSWLPSCLSNSRIPKQARSRTIFMLFVTLFFFLDKVSYIPG